MFDGPHKADQLSKLDSLRCLNWVHDFQSLQVHGQKDTALHIVIAPDRRTVCCQCMLYSLKCSCLAHGQASTQPHTLAPRDLRTAFLHHKLRSLCHSGSLDPLQQDTSPHTCDHQSAVHTACRSNIQSTPKWLGPVRGPLGKQPRTHAQHGRRTVYLPHTPHKRCLRLALSVRLSLRDKLRHIYD